MSKQIYKNLHIEGFNSLQSPTVFDLNRTGINIVKGYMGAGKTTIFSALMWVLHKVNLKGNLTAKVPTWQWLRNPETWQGTRVMVELDMPEEGKSYLIARHIDYKGKTFDITGGNTLMVFEKPIDRPGYFVREDMVGDHLYKTDQQAFINKLIGLSSDAFLNSILFGQRMKRLVESSGSDKRELFESIFEMAFVSEAKENCQVKINEASSELISAQNTGYMMDTSINNIDIRLEANKKVLQDFDTRKKNDLQSITEEADAIKLRIENTEKTIAGFVASLATYADYDTHLRDANAAKEEVLARITRKRAEIEERSDSLLKDLKASDDAARETLESNRKNLQIRLDDNGRDSSKYMDDIEALNHKYVTDSKAIYDTKIRELQGIVTDIQREIVIVTQNTTTALTALSQAGWQRDSALSTIRLLEEDLVKAEQDLKSFDDKCPTCGGKLSAKAHKAAVATFEDKITNIKNDIARISDKISNQVEPLIKEHTDTHDRRVALGLVLDGRMATAQANLNSAQGNFKASDYPELRAISEELSGIQGRSATAAKVREDIYKEMDELNAKITKLYTDRDRAYADILANDPELKTLRSDFTAAEIVDNPKATELINGLLRHGQVKASIEQQKAAMEAQNTATVEHLRSLNARRKNIQNEEPPKTDTDELTAQRAELSAQIRLLVTSTEALARRIQYLKWWNDKGFSAGGMKAFLFNTGLDRLNRAVEKYAMRLGVRLHFSVDLTKAAKPFVTKCFIDGNFEVDYSEFSGGEKASLDIATAFAMHDIVTGTSDINILILDEIFEGLDQLGVENVFELIRTKAGEDRTIFIITHLSTIDSLNTKTIEVLKDSNKNSIIN